MPPKQTPMSSRGRFELPAIAPIDYSLTNGTNIPPPEPSPTSETPPTIPASNISSAAAAEGLPTSNGHNSSPSKEMQPPPSLRTPTTSPSKRPASIRRFLSRKNLHENYENDRPTSASGDSISQMSTVTNQRSASRMSTASRPSTTRRSSSWFSRFMNGDERKRTSTVLEEKEESPSKKSGPPPPQLPQLNQLKAKVTEKTLGMDAEKMFGGIVYKA